MMTSEQWNGLIALMRAIAVASVKQSTATPGLDTDAMDAKRQAGECETNVRKMFVADGVTMFGEQRNVDIGNGATAVEVFTADGWKRIAIGWGDGEATSPQSNPELDRLLLITADVCTFLDGVRSGHHGSLWRHRADKLLSELELARVRVRGIHAVLDEDLPEEKKDTRRTIAASSAIFDGRMRIDASSIMVTLEHTVAAVLLALYGDPAKAAGMLNEALAPGVEARLAGYGAKPK